MTDDNWVMARLSMVGSLSIAAGAAARSLWCDGWTVEEIVTATDVPVETVQAWLNFRVT